MALTIASMAGAERGGQALRLHGVGGGAATVCASTSSASSPVAAPVNGTMTAPARSVGARAGGRGHLLGERQRLGRCDAGSFEQLGCGGGDGGGQRVSLAARS